MCSPQQRQLSTNINEAIQQLLQAPLKRTRPPKNNTQKTPSIPVLNKNYLSRVNLRFWANNPCSLNKNKRDEAIARLHNLDVKNTPHILFFAETWYNRTSDTVIPGFQIHRRDRDGKGGGVAIYIQQEITTLETNSAQLNSDSIEQIWRVIKLGNNSILLGCIYRPHDLNDETLENCIASIKASKVVAQRLECDFILIFSDFNFSNTFYEYIEIDGGVATTAHVLNERPGDMRFQDCLNECLLTQLITFKTYRNNRFSEPISTLDLVITDKPDFLIEI